MTIIDSTQTRPNGIALSPDESILYVANSDPNNAVWYKYALEEASGKVLGKEVFYDATENAKNEKGLPDGLKVNDAGYIFATGPGGVWVFNPSGKVIAKIRTGQATFSKLICVHFCCIEKFANIYECILFVKQ